ncbi:MAG: Trk family potassium uptake protein [Desulfobacteraceae bacterium]|nr:Trk family potassium uptake protein [Desulfobacteraceae bacterium]
MKLPAFIIKPLINAPGRILILGYTLLILTGAGLLMLPVATCQGYLNFVDALFTAGSAVCVTGLSVTNISTTFSTFGQVVIMGLIQVGGIGIMMVSTLFLLSFGKTLGLTNKSLMKEIYSNDGAKGTIIILKDVIVFTLTIEILGALIMFTRFFPEKSVSEATYYACFHAISAFCNAGFSLFSNNFEGYANDKVLCLTISALIILGGIGFIVLAEIKTKICFSKRLWPLLSLHTKLVLVSTFILLLLSTGLILFMEWHNTLAGMPLDLRVVNAFFQAVNARTAGFNSVPIGNMTNEALFLIIILMFIGTAPGSCGGGIKITTFSSILILGVSRIMGNEHPQIFNRKISDSSMSRTVGLVFISLFILAIGIMMLLKTEVGEVSHAASRGSFIELTFEAVSAFATAGLSTGITSSLSIPGRLIIVLLMFIGRLGPLAIAMAISRTPKTCRYKFAEENIMIG